MQVNLKLDFISGLMAEYVHVGGLQIPALAAK